MEELTEELLSFYNLSEKINDLTKKEKKKGKNRRLRCKLRTCFF